MAGLSRTIPYILIALGLMASSVSSAQVTPTPSTAPNSGTTTTGQRVAGLSGASSSFTDPTTGTFYVYGGFVNNATTQCTTHACDTCSTAAAAGVVPCNKNGIAPNVVFHLEVTPATSMSIPLGSPVTLTGGTTTATSITGTFGTTGSTYWYETTWASLCGAGGDPTCLTPFSSNFTMSLTGATVNGQTSGSDTFTFTVSLSVVDQAAVASTVPEYTPPCDISGNGATSGFCHFKAFPGDSKIYADDLTIAGDSNTTPFSGVKYNAVVFFYGPASPGTEAADLLNITSKSPSKILTFDTTQTVPHVDTRVEGLTNGQYYCMVMASQDQAGNIYEVMDLTQFTDSTTYCATPQPVEGLLDDKRCFIATAAYGSPFEAHVRGLRQFRDQVLLKTAVGRSFVEAYYWASPSLAAMIRQSDTARAGTRFVLAPVVFSAEFILNNGTGVVWLFFGAMIFIAVAGLWIRRRMTP